MSDPFSESLLFSGLPELVISAWRSAIVACAAVVIAHQIVRTSFHKRHSARSRVIATLTAVPLLTPRCLIIYTYMTHAQAMTTHPIFHEFLYLVLMLFILVPAAAAILAFAPPSPLSPSAVHCQRLVRTRRQSFRGITWLTGHRHLRTWTLAAIFTFLLAFSEMEMASLFGLRAWTVRLFDLQAGGLSITHLLGHALFPVVLEAAALTFGLILLRKTRGSVGEERHDIPPRSPWQHASVWTYLVIACMATCVVPTLATLAPTLTRATETWSNLAVGEEVRNTLLFATVSTLCVMAIVRLTDRPHAASGRMVLALPGLLGSLGVGLCVLALFQTPPLRPMRDSPMPLLFGLTLYLMPFALLLAVALRAGRQGSALHTAILLRASPRIDHRRTASDIHWILVGRKWLFVVFVLLLLAASDLILASLLTPSDMPTMMVMVYNQMHYGTSQRLGAMVFIVSVLPLSILIAALGSRHLLRWTPAHA